MNDRKRAALDRAAQEAQDRHRRNTNRLTEQDCRDAATEAQQRRSRFRIVDEGEK